MLYPFKDKAGCEKLWSDWIGLHVFYQQPHMTSPEYGVIVGIQAMPIYVHVLYGFDTTAKATRPEDLHWPPDYCAQDRVNPQGQVFSRT